MKRQLTCAIAFLLGLCAQSCTRERASQRQCQAIFDRIVEIELEELGFRDPLLAARHKLELAKRYRTQVDACVGRRISDYALKCIASAKTTEQVSHKCLR